MGRAVRNKYGKFADRQILHYSIARPADEAVVYLKAHIPKTRSNAIPAERSVHAMMHPVPVEGAPTPNSSAMLPKKHLTPSPPIIVHHLYVLYPTSLRLLLLAALNLHDLPASRSTPSRHPRAGLQHYRSPPCAHAHHSSRKLVPAIRRLEYVLLHRDAEAIAVVLWGGDGGFIFAAVFDPGLELFVPGVGADAVC